MCKGVGWLLYKWELKMKLFDYMNNLYRRDSGYNINHKSNIKMAYKNDSNLIIYTLYLGTCHLNDYNIGIFSDITHSWIFFKYLVIKKQATATVCGQVLGDLPTLT